MGNYNIPEIKNLCKKIKMNDYTSLNNVIT